MKKKVLLTVAALALLIPASCVEVQARQAEARNRKSDNAVLCAAARADEAKYGSDLSQLKGEVCK